MDPVKVRRAYSTIVESESNSFYKAPNLVLERILGRAVSLFQKLECWIFFKKR
ncbi:hypothetical protein LEP1GSC016_0202 [Leptospira borgpetersenii serovar Hardjo-bovis str. Sponselee]|uniref:Uncharacterized protein n=1 Tax=Leptospira borgpetersenii serovar Hardjo-bovis str. Sponselee TaxID=1303729 RepID=M6C8W5_LEPBO|nr:hypothetical protein LEP1GSC016_0202 [Leptospira borgpetersenii serovar Hardjo-bovis str. Sponselee]